MALLDTTPVGELDVGDIFKTTLTDRWGKVTRAYPGLVALVYMSPVGDASRYPNPEASLNSHYLEWEQKAIHAEVRVILWQHGQS